uniref:Uncharacterized protein n=1 Tax=Glossina austeni TaxID=7395 RepID=A0A1A9UST7_GLOAU
MTKAFVTKSTISTKLAAFFIKALTRHNNEYLRGENLHDEYFSDEYKCDGIRDESMDEISDHCFRDDINNEYLHDDTDNVAKPMTSSYSLLWWNKIIKYYGKVILIIDMNV